MLLCASFSRDEDEDPTAPLGPREFDRLRTSMEERALSLADLLTSSARDLLREIGYAEDRVERIDRLLERGGALATAVERWTSRGLWIMTRIDTDYPERLLRRLGPSAPPLLYGAGDRSLLGSGGLGVVGSRSPSDDDIDFVRELGGRCAEQGITIISGGAKGVDQAGMEAALHKRGSVMGVLCGDIVRAAGSGLCREAIEEDRLALITPYHPEGSFTVGKAMGRNKLIYTLSDWAMVVRCDLESGGTWTGATENLKYRWVPLLVLAPSEMPDGNAALIDRGGVALTDDLVRDADLRELFERLALTAGPDQKTFEF